MDGSDNVKVCVRVRPLSKKESDSGSNCVYTSANNLIIDAKPQAKSFAYDCVASEAIPQEDIFEMVGKPIADCCLEGYHGTIFAYGQTGSGKTYTIQGAVTDNGDNIVEHRGLIPRTLDYVFDVINRRQKPGQSEYICKCSYLEIYQENITDLLNPASQRLGIREDIKKGVYVESLSEEVVNSSADAIRLLQLGARNRHTGATAKNEQSSRSHSVFTLYIQSKVIKEDGATAVKYSRLHVIDLAGSERQKSTEATGIRLKEAGNINKSLLILGNVIRALVDVSNGKEHIHVQYRDSKLTFLLKDSLGGNSKTTIIATVSPAVADFGETLSTLKFAQRAKMIKNKAVINEDSTGSIIQLQLEIRKLKEALAAKAKPVASEQTDYSSYSTAGSQQSSQFNSPVSAYSTAPSSPSDLARGIKPVRLFNQPVQVDRIRQLESLLAEQSRRAEMLEQEKERIADKIGELQKLCLQKDYFIQACKMVARLRDSRIKKLESLVDGAHANCPSRPEESQAEIEQLKEQIEYLNYQITHHPEVLRFAIENIEQKELLTQYEALYGYENGEYQKLRQFVADLSLQIQKVISEKHQLLDIINKGGSSAGPASPSRTQLEVLKWKYEQQVDKLQSDMDNMRLSALEEIRQHQQNSAMLEQELIALRSHVEQVVQSEASHRVEKDRLYQQQQRTIDELKATYDKELASLQNGANMVESYNKKASLSILTLEKQLSQLAEEREMLMDDLKAKEDEVLALKRNLTQKDIETRRMSVYQKPVMSDNESDDDDFGDAHRASVEAAVRTELEAKMKAQLQEANSHSEKVLSELKMAHEKELGQWAEQLRRQSDELREVREMKDEYETLQEELQFTKDRIKDVEERKVAAEKLVSEMKKQLEIAEADNLSLQHSLDVSTQALKAERDERVQGLVQENDQLRDHNSKLRGSLDCKDEELEEEQEALRHASEQIIKLEQDMAASRDAILGLTDMVENLRSTAKQSAIEYQEVQRKLEDAEAVIGYKEEEIAALQSMKTHVDELIAERDDLREKIDDLISDARQQQDYLKSTQAELAKSEAYNEQERAQLEEQLRTQQRLHLEASQTVDDLRDNLEATKFRADVETSQLQVDLQHEITASKELRAVIDSLQEDNVGLSSMLKACQAELQAARAQAYVTAEASSDISHELNAHLDKLQAAETANVVLSNTIAKLREENALKASQHEESELKLAHLTSDLGATRSKLNNLMSMTDKYNLLPSGQDSCFRTSRS